MGAFHNLRSNHLSSFRTNFDLYLLEEPYLAMVRRGNHALDLIDLQHPFKIQSCTIGWHFQTFDFYSFCSVFSWTPLPVNIFWGFWAPQGRGASMPLQMIFFNWWVVTIVFAIKYLGGQALISVFYKRRLTKAFEALWLALVILSSGKSRYPEVMVWMKIITNTVHSFKGMSDKKNSFENQIWFSLIIRALCAWSSRFKWPSLVDVSATTGLTIWQWKGIMGRLEKIDDNDRDKGMIPLIVGLEDWKRLHKVAVAALSALSWFVGILLNFFFL